MTIVIEGLNKFVDSMCLWSTLYACGGPYACGGLYMHVVDPMLVVDSMLVVDPMLVVDSICLRSTLYACGRLSIPVEMIFIVSHLLQQTESDWYFSRNNR